MGVFKRGNKLWIRFADADGKWRNEPTHYDVGQEKLAEQMFAEVTTRVDAEKASPASSLVQLTVAKYSERWLDKRRALDHDWKSDRARLRHVLPAIGDLAIAEVRPRHLIEAFHRIRTAAEPIAQRTVYNVYSVVAAMFRDAKLEDLVSESPCILDERQLGPLQDKDPDWRSGALFSRDEATTLISSDVVPMDRRMLYAFMLLAGLRPGEASALRWRHYDPSVQPLGRMTIAVAYDSRRYREKSTKTDSTRWVPVHPTLAAMLAEWKLGGWESMVGRAPELDDLIIPLPPAHAAARKKHEGEPHRTEPYNGKKWREHDQVALVAAAGERGWRPREMYSMKATFITLVLDDGADPHVIETRVTHTKKSRSAFDGYNRGRQWEITCAEVAKLKLVRRDQVDAAQPVAVGADLQLVTDLVTAAASRRDASDVGLRRRASNPRPGG